MSDSLAGVVLAAGLGRRLRPLTLRRPKALCPVANVPLIDLALERLATVTDALAVNAHHHRAQVEEHLEGRAHVSVEEARPLGTAGALAYLRPWLDGRHAIVVNADAWCQADLDQLVDGWDRQRIRLLLAGEDRLGPRSPIAGAALPWSTIAPLKAEPSGLYEVSWANAAEAGQLDVVHYDGPFVDCGTPADYLAANLLASGGESVVGEGAVVAGRIERCVVWAGARVEPTEALVDAIRWEGLRTVSVRGR